LVSKCVNRNGDSCITKPWGGEWTWALTSGYAGKLLWVRSGASLSLQYHLEKEESMLCLSGRALLLIGRRVVVLTPGARAHIPPRTPHRLAALTDTTIHEVSSPQLDDVIRLADDHGRQLAINSTGNAADIAADSVEFWAVCRNRTAPAEYKRPMARDSRLASIAIMLASGQRLRACDLASRFRVSERTVYRDMQRLADQGFPLAAIPGPNGGYAIYGNAGARQVQLELDEAVALAIGASLATRLVSGEEAGAARRALVKIQAALPDSVSVALPDMLGLFEGANGVMPGGSSGRRSKTAR
jgi:mannose-6-phosphate isomerase